MPQAPPSVAKQIPVAAVDDEDDMPEEIEIPSEEEEAKKSIKMTGLLGLHAQSSAAAIEDSMNDRDLESSIANQMLTELPLAQVKEAPVEESKDKLP